jgi:ATP adenylyltransferase
MQHLYAPWRDEYLLGDRKIDGCVFCHISRHHEQDEALGVLYRDEHCFIVMNRYPYTPGHIMVIPHQHTANLEELSPELFAHISLLVQKGVQILKEQFHAGGVNIGMNLGEVAGAGIAEHVHYHILPRYRGDTNFITTIGQTRVIGTDVNRVYNQLKESFNDLQLKQHN